MFFIKLKAQILFFPDSFNESLLKINNVILVENKY